METVACQIRSIVPSFAKACSYEPSIFPDLSRADLHVISAVIVHAIGRGFTTGEEIQAYLEHRHSPYGYHVIDFILVQFSGDDPAHHLWTHDEHDRFYLLGLAN